MIAPRATARPQPPVHRPPLWHAPLPTETKLDNGLRVLAHHLPGQQIVSAVLVCDLPLSQEPAGIEGVATVCARTLDEGSRSHPGEAYAEALETIGAACYLSQGQSSLHTMVDVPAARLGTALELLAEAVVEPELGDADVRRHVMLRLAEIDQIRANSAQLAGQEFNAQVYAAESRVQRPVGGRPETVAEVTPGAVREFHRAHYGPNGATLVLAGDFTEDPAPLATAAFEGWTTTAEPVLRAPARPGEPGVRLVDRPGAVQADLRLGGFGIDRTDPRWPAFQVASYIMGGAFLSRLNRVLREERGFTYGIALRPAPQRDGGAYAVSGSFRTEVLGAALAETRELLDISTRPFTQAEVTEAIDYVAGTSPLRYATAEGLADQSASQAGNALPVDYLNRYLDGIRAVTPDSAGQAYAEIVDLDALSLIVVGAADELADGITAAGFRLS